MKHRGFDSSDRVAQVDYLRNEADGILMYDMDGGASAEELVEFWKSQDAEIPEWFDRQDEDILRRFVAEAQAQ